jgi:hypothetical protein
MKKYFEIQFRKGAHPIAVRVARRCSCGPGSNERFTEHDWSPVCDRFPPLVLIHWDQTQSDAGALCACLENKDFAGREIYAARPIARQRYDYLTALERWAIYHAPRHPIARPFTKVNWRERKYLDAFT